MTLQQQGHSLTAGVVGYGMAGRLIHARLLREAGWAVTDVVTRNSVRIIEAKSDWSDAKVHPDLASLLGCAHHPDILVIASPTGHHVGNAMAALDAGLPVVVDKPLAVDRSSAAAVVQHAGATGTPLTVFHNRRWDSEQLTLRRLLAEGALGTVHRFERRWERWRPVPKNRWRENAVGQGGGLLLDLGPHLVDSAIQLFGPVTTVRAELRALTTRTEDDIFLALDHESGTISHLWAGNVVGAPGPRTRVLGSTASYLVTQYPPLPSPFNALDPGAGNEGWLVRGDESTPVTRAPGTHADFYRAVARWLTAAGPIPVDPWDAVRTAAILDAARRSSSTGAPEVPHIGDDRTGSIPE